MGRGEAPPRAGAARRGGRAGRGCVMHAPVSLFHPSPKWSLRSLLAGLRELRSTPPDAEKGTLLRATTRDMDKKRSWQRHLALAGLVIGTALGLALAASTHAAAEDFPKPPALEAPVAFWKRVYSEINTSQGFLHDSRDLGIVYRTIDVPRNAGRRARERVVERHRKQLKATLRLLGQGRRSGLSAEQKRVLALFPRDVSNARLRQAAGLVRFQLGQANKFRAGLQRQGRWRKNMNEVFERRGLPTGLTALPHVESSFNPDARSSVGASGLWQFTRSTGRLFLRINRVVDERNDPWLSTVAAAKLLARNYQRTKSWPLAITAYNHGVGGMTRAIRRLGTRDIEVVLERYKSRTFGFASRNFYCSFLAALEIDRDPEAYFGPIERDAEQRPERVALEHYYKPAALAHAFDVSVASLRQANPALRAPVWNGQKYVPKGYELRLPRNPERAEAAAVLASIPASQRKARQTADTRYRVRRGDTLGKIAQRFGVSQRELVVANGLRSAHRIRAGQVLTLPLRGRARALAARQALPESGVYRVRRGENLASISSRFGISVRELAAWNRIRNPNRIRVGHLLRLSNPAAREGVYTVQRGDTIDAIARRLGVRADAIVALNRLPNRHRIQPGQRLVVPGS